MLSRVANSIYWLSRYTERAENVARFIDVNLQMILDLPSGSRAQWEPLVIITGDDATFASRYQGATRENVIQFLTFDAENPNSIVSCLRAARENARTVRDAISPEMWEQINTCYLMINTAAHDRRIVHSADGFFDEVKKASALFDGITDATMLHGEGWHFYRMGRLLERADKTSRLLDVKYFILLPSSADVGTTLDDIQWAAVLRSASAFEMYRQRHGPLSLEKVIDFLLLDHEFPRSVNYCLTNANASLHAISGTPIGTFRNPAEQLLGYVRAELAYTDVQQIIAKGLHEFLDALQSKMNRVDQTIYDSFFALRPVGAGTMSQQQGSG
jgi:uncharacterized alpha-E superfamily protein